MVAARASMDLLGEQAVLRHNALEGKTALICGASRGIGAATARIMAKAGANVIIQTMSIGAATNSQGQYTFTIPADRVSDGKKVSLKAEFIGYRASKVEVTLTGTALQQNFQLEFISDSCVGLGNKITCFAHGM